MIVILNRDVKGTGKAGEVVKVSDGYARNMLLPKGYATEATDGNIRNLENRKNYKRRKSGRQSCGRKSSGCIRKCKSCHQDQVRGRAANCSARLPQKTSRRLQKNRPGLPSIRRKFKSAIRLKI